MSSKTLTDRYSIPLREMEELPVREILRTPAGETVLDFGQNFAGYVKFLANFPAGTKIVLSHGEILQNGNFYHDNYRSAKTEITYVSDGREEWVRPRFTYMGFRYVKVEGWPGEPKAEDFVGVAVYSAMERTGWLETGHQKANQLFSNALWGLKSNFLDMPTDRPQRDERLGWTGDAQVFAPHRLFLHGHQGVLPQIPVGYALRPDPARRRCDAVKHSSGGPQALRCSFIIIFVCLPLVKRRGGFIFCPADPESDRRCCPRRARKPSAARPPDRSGRTRR